MRRVYVVTHPDVAVDPKVPVPQWSLSARGRLRMASMLSQPWVAQVGAVYCSAEQKAVDGAQILAGYLDLNFEVVEGLGEIDRSSTGYLPRREHRATADLLFERPDESVRGWETARAAQRRMVGAVEAVLDRDPHGPDLAIITHGGVAALYLCYLKGVEISRSEEAPYPGGGGFFCFDAGSKVLVHGWKAIDS